MTVGSANRPRRPRAAGDPMRGDSLTQFLAQQIVVV